MRGLFSSQEMLEIESYLTGRATPHPNPNPWVQGGGDRKFRLFACTLLPFVLLSLVCVGCTPRIIPPAMPRNAVPIYVADYGRHSSLILPDDKTGLVEFSWGDYPWFAENHMRAGDAIAALLWSSGSTLGCRHLPAELPHDELMHALSAKRLLRFLADADQAAALRKLLIDQFNLHRDTMIYNKERQFYFVRDDGHYWLAHNCNHLTAEWLRMLGCQVDGFILYSNFELDEVSDSPQINPKNSAGFVQPIVPSPPSAVTRPSR